MKLTIVNGPNLNLLGQREQSVYGNLSMENYFEELQGLFTAELLYFQSNVEGELINYLQGFSGDGIVLNAGGYTHTSVALRDCIAALSIPVIEVHISNVAARESFRHTSMLTPVCKGLIVGFGLDSYRLAINYFCKH
ncbi:MAG: type II 3-dehydroquinate dehydratase [Bacteroidota bacterium]